MSPAFRAIRAGANFLGSNESTIYPCRFCLRSDGRVEYKGGTDTRARTHTQTQNTTMQMINIMITMISHLDGSFTSVGGRGYCHSPALAVNNVDVHQPTLLHINSDGI